MLYQINNDFSFNTEIDYINIDLDFKESSVKKEKALGYLIDTMGVKGRHLLGPLQLGKELVIRLKDKSSVDDEVIFWAEQLARMIKSFIILETVKAVSAPPPSVNFNFHLATELAKIISNIINIPYLPLFSNSTTIHQKKQMSAKLADTGTYEYLIVPTGSNYLIVDDVIFTSQTAKKCMKAAREDRLIFAVLYGT